jgi:hypothetical protein
MFISDNGGTRIDYVFHADGGKAHQINFARPEVTGDGEQMRIAKKRVEWRGQIPIVAVKKKRAECFGTRPYKVGG